MSTSTLTIQELKLRALEVPLERPIRTAVETIPATPLVLIDIYMDQGIIGRSYIFGYTPLTLRPLVDLLENLAEHLQGKSISPIERFHDFEGTFRLLGRQGLLGMAISGIDMALWDALGRANDLSVARLLGGEEKPITAYDSYGMIDPAKDAALLEKALGRGFTAIKIKIGGGSLAKDLETVSAVREIIGDDCRLMVDYNQSLSVPAAIRRIDHLADYDLEWVEEPVPAEDLAGHASVRRASKVPIQTGENWWFPEDAARAIALQASDFAMLDVMKIGGVTGWMRAAAQAEGASLPVSSHIFVETSAHLLAVTPQAHFLEYLDIASPILQDPPEIEAGALRPRGPGLGLDWEESAVARYAL
jgi:mandelate racemase